MTIPYTLDRNRLTDEGGYFARVRSIGTADLDQIANRIVERGSTVGKADVLAVLHLLIEVCINMILEGWRIDLGGLVKMYCTIGGVFESQDDRFQAGRHTLRGLARPGDRLSHALQHRAKLQRQQVHRHHPQPWHLIDLGSDSLGTLTPGGLAELTGSRLRFDPAADDEGLFLIASDNKEQRLRVAYNSARRLIFEVPDLPPGAYDLEVRARVKNAASVRKGQLNQVLVVE